MGWVEWIIESFLWKSRIIVLTAGVASLVSSFILYFTYKSGMPEGK